MRMQEAVENKVRREWYQSTTISTTNTKEVKGNKKQVHIRSHLPVCRKILLINSPIMPAKSHSADSQLKMPS